MEERAKEMENLLSRATIRPVLHLSEIQPFTRCASSPHLLCTCEIISPVTISHNALQMPPNF